MAESLLPPLIVDRKTGDEPFRVGAAALEFNLLGGGLSREPRARWRLRPIRPGVFRGS